EAAQRALGAVVAVDGVAEPTTDCIVKVSGLSATAAELALYDLECSGLVSVASSDSTADFLFVASPLAEKPALDLARRRGWEKDYVANLRSYTRAVIGEIRDPLLAELLDYPLNRVRNLDRTEIQDLDARIVRSIPKSPDSGRFILEALRGECQRHLQNP